MDELDRWANLLTEAGVERSAQPARICELTVSMLDITGAGISMVTPQGNRGVICSTNDVAAEIEELQLTLGEGPCIDAVQSGAPVLIPDLLEPRDIAIERWPAFIEGAGTAGVRAVFALPMRIGAISVGALDLYRDRPGELSDHHLTAALMAADAAAIALLHLDKDGDGLLGGNGVRGSAHQHQVHQATGMVQIQLGVASQDAFLALRARAFASGRALLDVATDVVERRVRFSKEDT